MKFRFFLGNFIRQEMTLMMMNAELVDILHWRSTEVQSAESVSRSIGFFSFEFDIFVQFVEFSKQFDFRFENSADEFLNVYLWCKAPPDFDLPILENRSILLGYVSRRRFSRFDRRRKIGFFRQRPRYPKCFFTPT